MLVDSGKKKTLANPNWNPLLWKLSQEDDLEDRDDTDSSLQIADPARKSRRICKGLVGVKFTDWVSSKASPQVIETLETSSAESNGIEESFADADWQQLELFWPVEERPEGVLKSTYGHPY